MKNFIVCILLGSFCLARSQVSTDQQTAADLSPPSIGQRITVTLADKTVKVGKLARIDPDSITLLTDDGGGEILYSSMSLEDQMKFGQDANSYSVSADNKRNNKDYDGAIADYTKAIQLDPKNGFYFSSRGALKTEKGDVDGAIADYNEGIELKPDFSTLYLERGDALVSKGNIDEAMADYNKAIGLDPKNDSAYSRRADAKEKSNDHAGAIADYNIAINLNPNDEFNYFFRGIAKMNNGDLEGAIRDYTKDIQLAPKNNEAYDNRGVAKIKEGDLDGAISDYTSAIEIDPNDEFAYSHRADAKTDKGDTDGATADYNMATALVRAQTVQIAASTHSSQAQVQSDAAKGLTAGNVEINKTSQDDANVEFGWKVPISNQTDHDATNVSVEVSCRDKDDIEIDSFVSNDNAVPSGQTVNVTESTIIETPKWKQADHWVAKIHDHTPVP